MGPMLVAWQWSDTIYLSVVFQTRSSMLNQVFVGVYPPLGKMFAVMRMFEMDGTFEPSHHALVLSVFVAILIEIDFVWIIYCLRLVCEDDLPLQELA